MIKGPQLSEEEMLERRKEIDDLQAELDAEFSGLRRCYDRHLELLAWIVRQKAHPMLLSDTGSWPDDCWCADDPVLRWLAVRDPLIFELARHQVAAHLELKDADDISLAATLLVRTSPSLRGPHGDNLARDVVLTSLLEFFDHEDWNPWHLVGRKVFLAGMAEETPIVTPRPGLDRLAQMLEQDLANHPFLGEYPDKIITSDAIRSVWRSNGFSQSLDLPAKLFDLQSDG